MEMRSFSISVLTNSLCPEQWLYISVACRNEWMGTWTLGRTSWSRYWVWCCASIVSLICGCYQLDRDKSLWCILPLRSSLSFFLCRYPQRAPSLPLKVCPPPAALLPLTPYRQHFSKPCFIPNLIALTAFLTWLMPSASRSAFLTL